METLKDLYTKQREKLETSMSEITKRLHSLGKRVEESHTREERTRLEVAQKLARCETEWRVERELLATNINKAEEAFREASETLEKLKEEWAQIERLASRPTVVGQEPVDFRDTGV